MHCCCLPLCIECALNVAVETAAVSLQLLQETVSLGCVLTKRLTAHKVSLNDQPSFKHI